MLPCLVRVLFAFYLQGVLKFKCKIPAPKDKALHEFIMECRQLDKVKINLVYIRISVFAGCHLQTIS